MELEITIGMKVGVEVGIVVKKLEVFGGALKLNDKALDGAYWLCVYVYP